MRFLSTLFIGFGIFILVIIRCFKVGTQQTNKDLKDILNKLKRVKKTKHNKSSSCQ